MRDSAHRFEQRQLIVCTYGGIGSMTIAVQHSYGMLHA